MPIKNIPQGAYIGVYAITDNAGRSYIGSSNDIVVRAKQHCRDLRGGKDSRKLQNAYNEGKSFTLHILRLGHEGMTNRELRDMEREEIRLRGLDNTYNSTFPHAVFTTEPVFSRTRKKQGDSDRLNIVIPKGLKKAIEAHAKRKGESVNGLVNELLRADMGLSEDEWKQRDE